MAFPIPSALKINSPTAELFHAEKALPERVKHSILFTWLAYLCVVYSIVTINSADWMTFEHWNQFSEGGYDNSLCADRLPSDEI